MTDEERSRVASLRKQGCGYKKISIETGIPLNTIKTYCRRHLKGYTTVKELTENGMCPECGTALIHISGHRAKKFCSDKCRMDYWKEHQEALNKKANYDFVCEHCKKPFQAYGNSHRKYCSHECYIAERFGGVYD